MTDFLSASAPCPSSSPRLPSHSFIALSASAALAAPPGSAAANYKVPRAAFFAKSPSTPSAAPFVGARSGASLFSSSFVSSKKSNSADDWADDDILKLALHDIAPSALAGQVPSVDGVAEFRVAPKKKGEAEVRFPVSAEEYILRLHDDVRALQAAKAETGRLLAREVRVGERTNRRLAERVKEGEAEAAAMRIAARRDAEIRAAQKADAFNSKKKKRVVRMWECVARSEVGSSVSGSSVGSPACSSADVALSTADVDRAKAFSQVGGAWESKVWITDDESQVTEGTEDEEGKK